MPLSDSDARFILHVPSVTLVRHPQVWEWCVWSYWFCAKSYSLEAVACPAVLSRDEWLVILKDWCGMFGVLASVAKDVCSKSCHPQVLKLCVWSYWSCAKSYLLEAVACPAVPPGDEWLVILKDWCGMFGVLARVAKDVCSKWTCTTPPLWT